MKILFLTSKGPSSSLIKWITSLNQDELLIQMDRFSAEYIKEESPDFLISYNYRYIIKEDVLQNFPDSAINMHVSLLPWNRGADPNFWSIVEESPKGVTIHKLDKGIDTGDILVQKEVMFDNDRETLSSSYDKLHAEIQSLFQENWQKIRSKEIRSTPQLQHGSNHYHREFVAVEHILGKEGWNIALPVLINRFQNL